jgi:hypothetical protein
MAAANDGLIGVVGVEVQPATAEDLRKDVAGSGDALTGGASDTDAEGLSHKTLLQTGGPISMPLRQQNVEPTDRNGRCAKVASAGSVDRHAG